MSKLKLEDFLDRIQQDESVFPVDQFATKNSPPHSVTATSADSPKKKKVNLGNRDLFSEQTKPHKRRCMIDFDGTIHKYSEGWKDGTPYDPPFPGAREAIEILKEMGFEIVIYTARLSLENERENGKGEAKRQKNLLTEWLNEYEIPFDRMTADKEPAEFYIDDKAVRIIDGNWKEVIKFIRKEMANTGGK